MEADCQRHGAIGRRGPLRQGSGERRGQVDDIRWQCTVPVPLKQVGKHPRSRLNAQPPAQDGGGTHHLNLDRLLQPWGFTENPPLGSISKQTWSKKGCMKTQAPPAVHGKHIQPPRVWQRRWLSPEHRRSYKKVNEDYNLFFRFSRFSPF